MLKLPKGIKKSENSLALPRNYWNKTKYILLPNREIEEKDRLPSKNLDGQTFKKQ